MTPMENGHGNLNITNTSLLGGNSSSLNSSKLVSPLMQFTNISPNKESFDNSQDKTTPNDKEPYIEISEDNILKSKVDILEPSLEENFCEVISPNEVFNTISLHEDDESKGIILTRGHGSTISAYVILKPIVVNDKLRFTHLGFYEDGEKFGNTPAWSVRDVLWTAGNNNVFPIKDIPTSCGNSPTVYHITFFRLGRTARSNLANIRFTAVKERGPNGDLIIKLEWIDKVPISTHDSIQYKFVKQE